MGDSSSHGEEPPMYYSLDNDLSNTVLARDGECVYFHTSLSIDKKTGDINFFVRCDTETQVEFNAERNLGVEGFLNKLSAETWVITDKSTRASSGILIRGSTTGKSMWHRSAAREPIKKYRYPAGTVQLHKGESYAATGKVWDMLVWDDLLEKMEEYKRQCV